MRVRNWAAMTAGAVAVTSVVGGTIAAVVGFLLVGVAWAQAPKFDPVRPAAAVETTRPADALSAMLTDARAAHAKIRDYSGTYTRQERLSGTLGAEQVAEMKMRVNPVGVHVRFVRPDSVAGMEIVYSGARKDGKFGYRPAGAAGRKGIQRLDLDDSKFLAAHRHPASEWGVGPLIELIATATAREKALNNPVEVFTADYQFDKRNVTKYEIHTRRGHAGRYAAKMVVFIDKETKLPIRFEAYGDARTGAATGDLIEAYSFTDLKFNSGLGENAFAY
jgi:uncharacterized protein DUF1571